MIGAIIGDIVGSRFEFANTFDHDFELFSKECSYTDDTICTVGIADAILKGKPYKDSLLEWCRKYPHPMGAYGGSFNAWLHSANPQPYNSYGNGAAMRVSPIGWAYDSDAEIIRQAIASAIPSHNHIEGLIGATAVAMGIYYADYYGFINEDRRREALSRVVRHYYGDDWDSAKRLPQRGKFDETCQGCVPLAFYIVLHSSDFEDAIRNAISYGGDSDTLGAIVGSLAEAIFTIIPTGWAEKALSYLPSDMAKVTKQFIKKYIRP